MTEFATFKTRARTLDHLGRGQIADLPTAITELWKNAYDAYAQYVSLHVFEGDKDAPHTAAVFDNGVGMNRQDLEERWLVIGTESKLEDANLSSQERFGMDLRPRQGEKGIGRLSAAFVAPVVLAVSKKPSGRFVATLVDWRLFENPFLAIEDIRLPVEEFDQPGELKFLVSQMAEVVLSNLVDKQDEKRQSYLQSAWARFSQLETEATEDLTTAERIGKSKYDAERIQGWLTEWEVFSGLADHGTALLMIDIQPALAVWVEPTTNQDFADEIRHRLRETLVGFTNPLSHDRADFGYEVLIHRTTGLKREIASTDVFGMDNFESLEHYVRGHFDERGVFHGEVKAFGVEMGEMEYVPEIPVRTTSRDHVGPFEFCVGTFEQERSNTTHSPEQFEWLSGQLGPFSGIKVYRDGLRVQPYGRHDSDFFDIEERRSRHAGRHFWSHRRAFGSLAFSGKQNPNLRDKAGREGLVDNHAKRELRYLVIGVLEEFARRFFGTDAPVRAEKLPEVQKRNKRLRAADKAARTRRRRNLRSFLRSQDPLLTMASERLAVVKKQLDETVDPEGLGAVDSELRELSVQRSEFRPPSAPAKQGELEDKFRSYRDTYRNFAAALDDARKLFAEKEESLGAAKPDESARSRFSRNQSLLAHKVDAYMREVKRLLASLSEQWHEKAELDRSTYFKRTAGMVDAPITRESVVGVLRTLDAVYDELEESIQFDYEGFIEAIKQMIEGVSLESAWLGADNQRAVLEEQVSNLTAVAQLGISVEIIGHELEALDDAVRRNLKRLPKECQTSEAYKLVEEEHAALTERLRFLAPMKIAGYRSREIISGREIAKYVRDFFRRRLEEEAISFEVSDSFERMEIRDLRSRIYPAFVNLTNNAIYWTSQSKERKVRFDFIDGVAIVADTGPGVDSEDLERLFTIFFTRRRAGRGVGLYLAKANLAVANHSIRYATEDDPHPLGGANFVIEFSTLQRT